MAIARRSAVAAPAGVHAPAPLTHACYSPTPYPSPTLPAAGLCRTYPRIFLPGPSHHHTQMCQEIIRDFCEHLLSVNEHLLKCDVADTRELRRRYLVHSAAVKPRLNF